MTEHPTELTLEEVHKWIVALDSRILEYEDAGILSRQNDEAISGLVARIKILEKRLSGDDEKPTDKWNEVMKALEALYEATAANEDREKEVEILVEMYDNWLD